MHFCETYCLRDRQLILKYIDNKIFLDKVLTHLELTAHMAACVSIMGDTDVYTDPTLNPKKYINVYLRFRNGRY